MDRSIGWLSNLENNRMEITPLIIGQYMKALSNLENGNLKKLAGQGDPVST